MYQCKSKTVMYTAKATLNQLFSLVVNNLINESDREDGDNSQPDEEVKESVNDKMKQLKSSEDSNKSLLVVSQLLKGLVSHLNPEKDTLWKIPVNNSTTALALDLLAVMINEGKHELSKFKVIMEILDEVFDPLLNQITSMKSNYSISIRLINCITLLTVYIEWGLEPLTRWWLTFINIKANSWQKLIAFEVFTFIFNSKTLVKSLAESNEQWCLANILKIMEGHLESLSQPINDDFYGQNNPSYQSQKLHKHLEDNNFDTVIMPPNNAVLVKLLIEGINNLSYKFNDLSGEMETEDFKQNILNANHTKSLINILSQCLHSWDDEINLQTILKTFENILYISGKIGNSKISSKIINDLGRYTWPVGYEKMSRKNILIIKWTLNIYHCLNEYLDSKCWYYIFKIFQEVEPIIREELDLPPVEDERMNELIDKKTKSKIGILRNKGKIEDESKETEVKRHTEKKPKIQDSFEEEEKSGKFIQPVRSLQIKRNTFTPGNFDNQMDVQSELEPVLQSMDITGHQIAGQSFSDEIIKKMIAGLGELLVNSVEE